MRFKIIVVFLILFYPVYCDGAPTIKFTAKAIDSNGNPIENAEVNVRLKGHFKLITGKTDKKGLFTASGQTTRRCSFSLKKEGYYISGYSFEHVVEIEPGLLNRWQPWNPTIEIVMKEKKNPIPMYVSGTMGPEDVPAFNKPVGYDFKKGDWVAPYGDGAVKDFIFTFNVSEKNVKPWDDEWRCSYTLTFSNPKDGIQEYYPPKDDHSKYKWPYQAPPAGYKSKLEGFSAMEEGGHHKTSYDKNRRYIFRVRTEVDGNGNIVKALYGKMSSDIRISPSADGWVTVIFGGYLNPTGTRNIEFSGKNLFTSDENKYPY